VPITGKCLTIEVGSYQWLVVGCDNRQNATAKTVRRAACHAAYRVGWGLNDGWSCTAARPPLRIANRPFALHARMWPQAFARGHRPSSGRGTSPKRNTVPRGLPHLQRAGAEKKVAVLYAKSSSTLICFCNSRRDLEDARASASRCDGLAILPGAMKVREEILTDLPRRFLDANQGSGQTSKWALRSAADNTTVRLHCQHSVRTANKER